MSENGTCRCGAEMKTTYLNKKPIITQGRKARLIRQRCVNYRPFRDFFLGKHNTYGDTGNLVDWVE